MIEKTYTNINLFNIQEILTREEYIEYIKYTTEKNIIFLNEHAKTQDKTNDEIKLQEAIERLEKTVVSEKNLKKYINYLFSNKSYKINYLKELNLRQLEAVSTISGKSLVIAGAGTGKTKTLTYRTSFLMENGINSENILLLTFTKKASMEIKNRIINLFGNKEKVLISTGTFHSFCASLLRKYSKLLNIYQNFIILDQGDSIDLIDQIKKDLKKELPEKLPKNQIIQAMLSQAVNFRKTIDEIILKEKCCLTELEVQNTVKLIINKYHEEKHKRNLFDYDDLIDVIIYYLKTNSTFKEIIQNRYKYIMIDEYQDTNLPQKELLDLLAEREDCSLMVVGDDHQSIYGFRGANYKNILLFSETFPDAKLIKLVDNYRSSENILKLVNHISSFIKLGYKKELIAVNNYKGKIPEILTTQTQYEEASVILNNMNVLIKQEKFKYENFAVLTRASHDSVSLQAIFLSNKIPFVVVGGLKFTEKRHIKDMLAFMKFIYNSSDIVSLGRILLLINKVGLITAKKITARYLELNNNIDILEEFVKKYPDIAPLYKMLIDAYNKKTVKELVYTIFDYYQNILNEEQDDNWVKRQEDLKIFVEIASSYNSLAEFLDDFMLDSINNMKNKDKKDQVVTISTIHGSKGLEWDVVFIMSVRHGKIPHVLATTIEELEEERRLFYVALSRAKKYLFLTSPELSLSQFIDRESIDNLYQ